MSYIDDTLMQNETIIYRCKPHWIIFGPTLMLLLMFFASLTIIPSTDFGQFAILGSQKFHVLTTYLSLGAFFISGGLTYIDYISSEFGITDKRVLMKIGFIRRQSASIFLSKVESIMVNQSVPGRILNYGSIVVVGTGGTKDFFRSIPNPLTFRKVTQQQIYQEIQRHA